nr:hypothetical protein [Lysobacter terrigena]
MSTGSASSITRGDHRDQAAVFRRGNEEVRTNERAIAPLPPQQRLGADPTPVVEADDRLQHDEELAACERHADRRGRRHLCACEAMGDVGEHQPDRDAQWHEYARGALHRVVVIGRIERGHRDHVVAGRPIQRDRMPVDDKASARAGRQRLRAAHPCPVERAA